ncbi:MAG: alpha-galactosidase [Oscillospiraceae bacterium]|nr:alpha-galactosidase [Oscillospiraceae bacterium]
MGISFYPEKHILSLETANSCYQMKIGPLGYLLHLYYGPRCSSGEFYDYLHLPQDRGFTPNPYDLAEGRGFSLDALPQEFSCSACGDSRLPSILLHTESGICGVDLRYRRHEIREGKYSLNGLPSAFDADGSTSTLSVTLADEATGIEIELLYAVFEATDIITRSVRIRNTGSQAVFLDKLSSACLDLPFGSWELLHFQGRHAMERLPERAPVLTGIQTLSSERGISSHQQNPFVILCEQGATEDAGFCYGAMLCYSGNHQEEIERSPNGSVRLLSGIGERYFCWKLDPGSMFDTPEVFLSFSAAGLTGLSHHFHRFLRRNLCRSRWNNRPRPVLLNSWEASYFDFDEETLLRLAREASELGVELFVLDDGWFGTRTDDRRALGDWVPNPERFPNGLGHLIDEVNRLGLQFGLWIEPEMVSEDSALYRTHPDWALQVPGRKPVLGRDQLVLDLSRQEVADWMYETFSSLLRENNIRYIKWDMNRVLADLYSAQLPADRQGEVAHRYVLNLYKIVDRITSEFPEVLFEGCSGGGGRFDAGMLAWFPQIWCSDNTDPIARLRIQEGTSFGYSLSSIAAHVSASPNHQTGRSTPIGTRAVTAMTGAFGYELNPALLSEEEKSAVRSQIARFRELSPLLQDGLYYRLPGDSPCRYTAWSLVSPDRGSALLSLILTQPEANPLPLHLRLKGLQPDAGYRVAWAEFSGCRNGQPGLTLPVLSGASLMQAGITLPPMYGDFPAVQILFVRQENQPLRRQEK